MPRACRILGVAAALAAWLVTTGLAWDGLQLAAWANMARLNARTMSADAAVRAAVTGAPCEHCKAVREAREDAERNAPAANQAGGKSIADLPPLTCQPFAFLAPRAAWALPTDLSGPRLPIEVPVPPPRARAA